MLCKHLHGLILSDGIIQRITQPLKKLAKFCFCRLVSADDLPDALDMTLGNLGNIFCPNIPIYLGAAFLHDQRIDRFLQLL